MATNENIRREVGKSLFDIEPSSIIELYELYFDVSRSLPPFRFHAGTNNLTKDIIWNGNPYRASAVEVEGFEANIMSRLPRPKISVSNKDFVISNILRDYSDFRNGKFVRIKLFLKHLDDINFDNNQNPFGVADPSAYISKEKYIISQKIIENKQLIQFELITPFDLESLESATRAIYGRYCYWQYRGSGCNYQGDLICKDDDSDFSIKPNRYNGQFLKKNETLFKSYTYENTVSEFKWTEGKEYLAGSICFIENLDFNGFKDPPRTFFVCIKTHISSNFITPDKSVDYWQKDGCSKTINSCKKRFKNPIYYSSLNEIIGYTDAAIYNGIIPFGGFPGTDKFKYE
jgi:lambda family phage minor tail protein L